MLASLPPRLKLAHLPTPLWRNDALDELMGLQVWVKRDDMSAGPAAGNKIRKLEFLLADARKNGTTIVITCGGLQSNHARATAILGKQLGMSCHLMLRTRIAAEPPPLSGNTFLDQFVGAHITLITKEAYQGRNTLMRAMADKLEAAGQRPYVICEGGSNGLGAFGYLSAVSEIADQLQAGQACSPKRFDVLVHACGSGGTAAGVALGNKLRPIADQLWPVPVCDDGDHFAAVVGGIVREARELAPGLPNADPLRFLDGFQGPAYAEASLEQLEFMHRVARTTGLVLDPVYSGKALFALYKQPDKPKTALFIHTGGLPGLLADADAFSVLLGASASFQFK